MFLERMITGYKNSSCILNKLTTDLGNSILTEKYPECCKINHSYLNTKNKKFTYSLIRQSADDRDVKNFFLMRLILDGFGIDLFNPKLTRDIYFEVMNKAYKFDFYTFSSYAKYALLIMDNLYSEVSERKDFIKAILMCFETQMLNFLPLYDNVIMELSNGQGLFFTEFVKDKLFLPEVYSGAIMCESLLFHHKKEKYFKDILDRYTLKEPFLKMCN